MEKKDIEIPFGAFDSELGGFEYTIPEGYKAEIKDGKVVVRKTESEGERIRKEIIATIHLYYGEPLENEAKEMIAWLENQGEQKPEWSDEDINKIDTIIGYIASSAGEKLGVLLPCINWLKSLKDRVQPQNTWKPSEEQIKAVKEAACYSSVFSGKTIDNLISLSKQLKKLTE